MKTGNCEKEGREDKDKGWVPCCEREEEGREGGEEGWDDARRTWNGKEEKKSSGCMYVWVYVWMYVCMSI